ncbi:MAG TPA: gas vesicle protein GvpG [Oculatellaceae cyanobacterium]
MGIISKVLTFPLTGPLSGLVFIAKHIRDQVDEQEKELSPQARLLELESLLLLGEITDEEYQRREEELLAALDAQLEAENEETADNDESVASKQETPADDERSQNILEKSEG